MSDIFLSYNRQDIEKAKLIAESLTEEGFSVWWDMTLRSGESYDEVTENALRSAKAVVVLWSPRSVVSRWVRAEATVASRLETLLPAMIEPCERPIMFELTQTASLEHWHGDRTDAAWRGLVSDIARQLAGEGNVHRAPSAAPLASAAKAPARLALPDKPSIAILPFADLADTDDGSYFAEGMADEITTMLGRIKSLFVIGNSSTLNYTPGNRDLKQIAQDLGVRYLLEGNVRRAGERVRIAVNLCNALENIPVWAERFEGSMDDIFTLQDEVALAVADKIVPNIETAELQRTLRQPTQDMGAYDLYLRALSLFKTFEPINVGQAMVLLDQAIARDPNFALPLAAQCVCHSQIFMSGWSADLGETYRTGHELGQRALASDPTDPMVVAWVGVASLTFIDEVTNITAIVDRALEDHPGTAFLLAVQGLLKVHVGEPEKALEVLEQALRLDPRSVYLPFILMGQGISLFSLRRFEEAIPYFTEMIERLPMMPTPRGYLAACWAHLGEFDKASAALAATPKPWLKLMETSPHDPRLIEILQEGLILAGVDWAAIPPLMKTEPAN